MFFFGFQALWSQLGSPKGKKRDGKLQAKQRNDAFLEFDVFAKSETGGCRWFEFHFLRFFIQFGKHNTFDSYFLV